mmetsp:Transcript_38613/g.62555  ORF Transcript_38613/g.62555 Transcript_38613/m.62555 type:complete len:289 (-) Transcript_38613:553-1419(-)
MEEYLQERIAEERLKAVNELNNELQTVLDWGEERSRQAVLMATQLAQAQKKLTEATGTHPQTDEKEELYNWLHGGDLEEAHRDLVREKAEHHFTKAKVAALEAAVLAHSKIQDAAIEARSKAEAAEEVAGKADDWNEVLRRPFERHKSEPSAVLTRLLHNARLARQDSKQQSERTRTSSYISRQRSLSESTTSPSREAKWQRLAGLIPKLSPSSPASDRSSSVASPIVSPQPRRSNTSETSLVPDILITAAGENTTTSEASTETRLLNQACLYTVVQAHKHGPFHLPL